MFPFFRRTIPEGSTCFDPFPAPRVRVFPPFEDMEQRPGHWEHVMIGFDTAADGHTEGVTLLDGDPASDLATEARKAVEQSRFVPGERHGCALPFRLLSKRPLAPPPLPEARAFADPEGDCDGLPQEWASMPPLTFPAAFKRRNIEGWAIVRFDVAPWGAIGNASVVKAEPAAAFGEAAKNIVERARKAPSPRGYSGCVDRVLFKMKPRGGEDDESEIAAIS